MSKHIVVLKCVFTLICVIAVSAFGGERGRKGINSVYNSTNLGIGFVKRRKEEGEDWG